MSGRVYDGCLGFAGVETRSNWGAVFCCVDHGEEILCRAMIASSIIQSSSLSPSSVLLLLRSNSFCASRGKQSMAWDAAISTSPAVRVLEDLTLFRIIDLVSCLFS